MQFLLRFVVLLTTATLCAHATAHPGAAAISSPGYTTRLWQTQDGLPEQTVQAFAQTADGYLWIGTSGGLLRFDGSRFVEFSRETTPAFVEDSVFCLTSSRDGSLWIGTEGGGLIRLKDGRFRRYTTVDGLTDGFVRAVFEDRRGRIWIGTDNGLFQLQNSDSLIASRIDDAATIAPIAVHAITSDREGRLWVGGSRLIVIDPANSIVREFALSGQYSETRVKSILQTHDNTIWVGTVSGLQSLAPGAKAFVPLGSIRSTVRTLHETTGGTLWIGTIGQGAFTWQDHRLTPVPSQKPLPSNTVLSVFEDQSSNIWMGTQAGMLRFSRTPVDLVALPNAADSDFETISRDNDGTLWVASTRVFRLVNGVAMPFTFNQLKGARARNIFRDRSGSLWIGTDGRGLFQIDPTGISRQFTTANGLVNNFVRSVMQARNGDIWVATDEGVSHLSPAGLRNFQVRDGLAYFSVRAMLEDNAGDLWIGTDRGLSHLHNDRFQTDAATEALKNEKVWAIHQSPDGTPASPLWFGTRNNGLYRFAANEVTRYTVDQGLANNTVYSILEDTLGHFWIGSANGISLLNRRDLDALAVHDFRSGSESAAGHLSPRLFTVSDGGEIATLYGGTQPSGVLTPQGDVWFPTNKGPVRISAESEHPAVLPRIFIDQITADGRDLPVQSQIKLPADNSNLEVSYSSLLLGSQDGLQFRYKLDGFDRDWRYASARKVAYYTNLPPGRYTFRVRAFEVGSGTQDSEASFTLIKQQYFYKTTWFLAVCVMLLGFIAWWMHYLRLRRVRIAFDAILEERARLAREMHDTLIQGCASVSLLLEACSSADADSGDHAVQQELLDYARTQLATSIDEARQAVWNLRGDTSDNLSEMLIKLAGRTERSSTVPIQCTIDGQPYDFSPTAMHEIMMVSREAIYNALLHASPTRITLHAIYEADDFRLVIRDDGSGFEVSNTAAEGHYGLLGIQERIRRLDGTVSVSSVTAQGTEIDVRIPRSAVQLLQEQLQ